jgi:hypothetical protein
MITHHHQTSQPLVPWGTLPPTRKFSISVTISIHKDMLKGRRRGGKRLASKDKRTFHDWAKLPNELKLNILTHYVLEDSVFHYPSFKSPHWVLEPNVLNYMSFNLFLSQILAIKDHEFVSLALDVCYKRGTFSVDISATSPTGKLVLPVPSSELASKIRHLETLASDCVIYDRSPQLNNMLLNPESAWR